MSRINALVLLLAVPIGLFLATPGSFSAAQDAENSAHPAIGSWLVDSDPGDAEYSPRLMTLSADGTALFVSGRQTMGTGAWESTGASSAIVTFLAVTNGPAYISIRAAIEFTPDGLSVDGTFTIEVVLGPDAGESNGQIGPGTLTGERITAEAPGTPVESFEEFFPSQGATPESSPVA